MQKRQTANFKTIELVEGIKPVVVKTIRMDPLAAVRYARDVADYHRRLKESIGEVAELHSITISPDKTEVKIIQQHAGDKTAEDFIKNGTETEAIRTVKKILKLITPALQQRSVHNPLVTSVPIDPKPDNFAVDKGGKMRYIDLTPPYKIEKDGSISFWQSIRLPEVRSYAARKAHPVGIVQDLFIQVSRLRPELCSEFGSIITETLRGKGMAEEARGVGAVYVSKDFEKLVGRNYTSMRRTAGGLQSKRSVTTRKWKEGAKWLANRKRILKKQQPF